MKLNVKLLVLIPILAIIFSSLGYAYASYTLTYNTYLESGSLVDQASYTIFVDDGTYYLKNGSTGRVDWSSSNIAALTQAALNNLTSGGSIYFKQGEYVFSTYATFPETNLDYEKDINIFGDGWSTIFKRSAAIPVFMLANTTTGYRVRNTKFFNIRFHSNGYTGALIYLRNADKLRFDSVQVYCDTVGAYAIFAENTWDVNLYACLFHGGGSSTQAIVRLYNGEGATQYCDNWRFISCRFERGISYDSIAIHSDASGAGAQNKAIYVLESKLHGFNHAGFDGGAILFNNTVNSAIRGNTIQHHDGNVIVIDDLCKTIDISDNLFQSYNTVGTVNAFIYIEGDYCTVGKNSYTGSSSPTWTQLIYLSASSSNCIVDVENQISVYSGTYTVLTDDGDSVTQKSFSYLIYKVGSIYYASSGSGGIDSGFHSTNFASVVESCLAEIYTRGGKLVFAAQTFSWTDADIINIPYLTDSVTFEGMNGYGKSTDETGTHFKFSGTGAAIDIAETSDVRSAFGLVFRNIKFVDANPDSGSICLKLDNLDTGEIESCTFLGWGVSIACQYSGVTYPVAEQNGKLFIHHNEFAEGEACYIYVTKGTQIDISNNIFESFGDWEKCIWFAGVNKARISANEFNDPTTPAGTDAHIYLTQSGSYNTAGIIISDNWAYIKTTDYYFIYQGTADYGVISKNNEIELGYDPIATPHSPYYPVNWMDATDWISKISPLDVRIMSPAFAFNTTYQNLYSPMKVYLDINITDNAVVTFYLGHLSASNNMGSWINPSGADLRVTILVRIPTGQYWKFTNIPTATLNQIKVIYE